MLYVSIICVIHLYCVDYHTVDSVKNNHRIVCDTVAFRIFIILLKIRSSISIKIATWECGIETRSSKKLFFNQGSAPTNHELDFGIEPACTNALSNFVLVSTNGTLAAHAVAIPTLHQPPSCCDWSVGLPTSKIYRNNIYIYIYIYIYIHHMFAWFGIFSQSLACVS